MTARRALPAVIAVCLALLGAISATAQEAESREPTLLGRGGAVFQRNCAGCHGTDGAGRAGTGDRAGPPIDEVEVAYVDLTLRTGRMPIADPGLGVRVDKLLAEDREAVVAWMQDRFDLPGELPQLRTGRANRGQEPYVRFCAACHGAGGGGGVAGGGTFVPVVRGLDAVTITEAVRVGPFQMPAFPEAVIDQQTVADIAAYLEEADQAPRTLLGLRELHAGGTGLFVLLLAGIVVLLLRLVARPTDDGEAPQ